MRRILGAFSLLLSTFTISAASWVSHGPIGGAVRSLAVAALDRRGFYLPAAGGELPPGGGGARPRTGPGRPRTPAARGAPPGAAQHPPPAAPAGGWAPT